MSDTALLLEGIKDKLTEAEYAAVCGVVTKNVVALGTDEAFALRDADGEIRAFKHRVTLSAEDGTLIQPVPNGPWTISAQGYEILSEATGTCVLFPMQVLVDGQMQQNPYVGRDPKNGRILAVSCRAIAFRFSSKGIPQVADWTTMFDTPSYRMIDLLGKAKKYPTAFRLLPLEDIPNKDKGATWAKYAFDESTNLWINTAHEEALQWYSQIINREKKAIDFAQTFARRNAVKHLLGLQKAPGPKWTITVLCWRPITGSIVKWDATQYIQLQERVEGIVRGSGGFASNRQIEMRAGTDRVSDEAGPIEHEMDQEDETQGKELEEVIDVKPNGDVGDTSPDTTETSAAEEKAPAGKKKAAAKKKEEPPSEPEPPAGSEKKLTREEQGIMRNYEMAKTAFPDEHKKAMESLGIEPAAVISVANAAKVCDAVNRILDGEL